MDHKDTRREYARWCTLAAEDPDIAEELAAIRGDEEKIKDAFCRDLSFGTGGLRGVIGAGTNRMNIYTVAKASQGLADYVNASYAEKESCAVGTGTCGSVRAAETPRIAVSYDSRIKSEVFARVAAEVFAANGIQVCIYPELMPTPCLSYAVRSLGCSAGVMVTASHNPAKYNGYKVYGPDGCQITTKAAEEIQRRIDAADPFLCERNAGDVPSVFPDKGSAGDVPSVFPGDKKNAGDAPPALVGVRRIRFEDGLADGRIRYVPDRVTDAFIAEVKAQSLLGDGAEADKDIRIVYTPLNGTGLKPVLRTLTESGYANVTVVEEQRRPDGHFPTCPYPNPEIREALALGLTYARRLDADLLLATDPDCDRVGIAVKDGEGGHVLLTGNETGLLLLDYICSRRIAMGTMPEEPVLVKTIVTTDMAERIAAAYGVRTVNVLTGFKYIGEQIGLLEAAGRTGDYIFGFEESYGYLTGAYVRDKDAVDGALMICDMAAYYHARGVTLREKLGELYRRYGYCLNTLHSYQFEGADGFGRMQDIMGTLRSEKGMLGGEKAESCTDYRDGIGDLPKADVLKYYLADASSVVVRPSGTEPKIKVYISVSAATPEKAGMREKALLQCVEKLLKQQ